MKNKYCDFTIRECTRENTCFKCDDPDCRKAGDIEADCQLYDCAFKISKCHSCEYNMNNMDDEADKLIKELHEFMLEKKVTIRGMSGEKLIITDQETGEEYIVKDLGYPI